MLREKKGSITVLLIIVVLVVWAVWKFVCKPVYHHFTKEKTVVEQIEEKKEPDLSTLSGKFKHPIKYTKSFFNNEEEEKEADEKIESCNSLLEKKDFDNALIACDEALEKTTNNGKTAVVHQLRGKIYQNSKKYDDARKEFVIASHVADTAQQKQQSEKLFKEADNLFKDAFLNKEYNNRKLLLPVERPDETLPSRYISTFQIDNMPDVKMPIGHPTPNQLYIAHPYLEKNYIPFEDYEMDFLGERVREFCEFAQALGATEVVIESIQTKSSEDSTSTKTSKKGKANAATVVGVPLEGNFDKSNANTQYLLNTALRGISISQKFTPSQKPFLPTNLVWYEHEPSWQQLYRQRMRGGLQEHHEKIESKKSRMVQSTELSKIKGELKSILNLAGMEWNEDSEKKLNTKDDMEMTIYVKFAPLDTLENNNGNDESL